MAFRNRFAKTIAISTVAFTFSTIQPTHESRMGFPIRAAYAQENQLDALLTKNPLSAGPRVLAKAKTAKVEGSSLESAKKLHSILKIKAPGGLRAAVSGSSLSVVAKPLTAEEAMSKPAECAGLALATVAALNKMDKGINSGIIILDLGTSGNSKLLHYIAYAEINGKEYLVDLQQDTFGIGGAKPLSGRFQTFNYEEAKAGTKVKLLRDIPFERAGSIYFLGLGAYYESINKSQDALLAYKKALAIDPSDKEAKRKVDSFSAVSSTKNYNQLVREATKAFKTEDWANAAGLFSQALSSMPDSMGNKGKAGLHANIGICNFNSSKFDSAAQHFGKAYELTKNPEFKKLEEQAKKAFTK